MVAKEDEWKDTEYRMCENALQAIEEEYSDRYSNLTDNLVFFGREIYEMALASLIGHEIGHHYLEHFKKNPMLLTNEESQREEFDADSFGVFFAFQYMLAYLKEGNYLEKRIDTKVFNCVDYKLLGLPVLHYSTILFFNGTPPEGVTHPRFAERINKVWSDTYHLGTPRSVINIVEEGYRELIQLTQDTKKLNGLE